MRSALVICQGLMVVQEAGQHNDHGLIGWVDEVLQN
jgi:hypothetical protein